MGIEDREYVRRQGFPSAFGTGPLWAIKFLLIANIAVFLLQSAGPAVVTWLQLDQASIVEKFQLWRLVTYGFCHSPDTLGHIFFNMFILWMFGRSVEPILGSREFLAFFLVGVLLSGVGHILFEKGPVIGASGGVMAVVFLTAMTYPRMTVLLFFIIPIELRWLAVMYVVGDLMGVFGSGTASRVAHVAHLAGAAFGVAYKYYGWQIMPFFRRADRMGTTIRANTIPAAASFLNPPV